MALSLSFLSLEIRILTEILHKKNNDYVECYLVFPQKAHKCMKKWVWFGGECNRSVPHSGKLKNSVLWGVSVNEK